MSGIRSYSTVYKSKWLVWDPQIYWSLKFIMCCINLCWISFYFVSSFRCILIIDNIDIFENRRISHEPDGGPVSLRLFSGGILNESLFPSSVWLVMFSELFRCRTGLDSGFLTVLLRWFPLMMRMKRLGKRQRKTVRLHIKQTNDKIDVLYPRSFTEKNVTKPKHDTKIVAYMAKPIYFDSL